MPSNEDLFAGFQVGGDINLVKQPRPKISANNADLMSGFDVGGDNIKPSNIEAEAEQRGRIEGLEEIGGGGLLFGEDKLKVAAISPVLLSATDPREMASIISSNFPNIGITETPEGEILATNNKTGTAVVVNKPGLSKIDILQGLGIIAAFTPAGAGKAVLGRIAGAGATEAGFQAAQAGTGGEFDVSDVALATGLGAAGEVIAPVARAGMQVIRQGRQAKALGVQKGDLAEVSPAIASAEEAAEKTGVELFEAQKTAVPSRLEEQAFVASLPEGAITSRRALIKQNKQAAAAVDDILNIIATPSALETGPIKIKTAANQALAAKKLARSEASSPIYKQAFRRQRQGKVGLIDTNALQIKIKKMSEQFDPGDEIGKNLNAALVKVSNAQGDLRKLHMAKIELDQRINSFGANAVGNTTKRFIRDVQGDLVEILRKQSPSYRAAMDEFKRTSPAVEAFESSTLGKIADIDDTQLKTISRRIFDPAETNLSIIRTAKNTVESIDPQAWREIIRTELERRIGSVRGDIADAAKGGVSIENLPAQLSKAIFGNNKQKAVLLQGSPPDVAANLKYLETALRRAGLGRPGGSQTAIREEIKKNLRPGIGQSIRNFIQAPIATVTGIGEEAAFNRKVRSLTEALYDPQWKPRMAKIRRMDPVSDASGKAMLQLLNDVESTQEGSQ